MVVMSISIDPAQMTGSGDFDITARYRMPGVGTGSVPVVLPQTNSLGQSMADVVAACVADAITNWSATFAPGDEARVFGSLEQASINI